MTEYQCPRGLLDSRLIALDIETTGLSMTANTIIELGVVEVVRGEVKTKYSKLFGGGRSPMYLVKSVHHIKDSDRLGKPTFLDTCARIAEWIGDAVIVTHNGAKFDIPFMQTKMQERGVAFNFSRHYDTYVIAKNLKRNKLDWNGKPLFDAKGKPAKEGIYEKHTLEYMCGQFGIPYDDDNHRGLKDCWNTLQLLYALCDRHGESAVLE